MYLDIHLDGVAARLNLRVTQTLPEFTDGALLIPRFDRRSIDGKEIRLGVESLHSVSGVLDSLERPRRSRVHHRTTAHKYRFIGR